MEEMNKYNISYSGLGHVYYMINGDSVSRDVYFGSLGADLFEQLKLSNKQKGS